jgi:hypothetical protein
MSAPRFARKLRPISIGQVPTPVPHRPLGYTNALSVLRFTVRWSFPSEYQWWFGRSEEYSVLPVSAEKAGSFRTSGANRQACELTENTESGESKG